MTSRNGSRMHGGLVIIPAFNEVRAIGDVLRDVKAHAPGWDVVVIDDASEDATAAVAAGEGARVLRHPFNLGYGAALQTGYRYALQGGYPVLVQMDGDGQHDAREIAKLAAPVQARRADVSIGTRFFPGSRYRMPPLRRAGSRWFALLVRLLSGLRVTDPTSGFQAVGRPVLRFYCSERFPADYPDADVLVLLQRSGVRLVEVPVVMHERRDAPSMHGGVRVLYYIYKMTLAVVMNALRPTEPIGAERSEEASA